MKYEEMSAAELKALCIEKGVKPSRAKADMIEDLKARDAADELIQLGAEEGLYGSETVSAVETGPETLAEPTKSTESPSAPSDTRVRIEGGSLYKTYPRNGLLSDREHQEHLDDVVAEALSRNQTPFGPAFRDRTTDETVWLYGVNIR